MQNILVTGANGHVGYNLAKALLEKGYNPRVSVRDAADQAKAGPLRALGLDDIVSLDVTNPDQFESATKGIDLLFHVAATYKLYTGDPADDRQMIADSVEGTRVALSAAKNNGVAKVVMTSSVATLPLTVKGAPPSTEEDWLSDLSVPYYRAKTEAEKTAWKIAGDLGLNLVAVLPGVIIGGGFHRRTASTDIIEGIMLGGMRLGAPNSGMSLVDIHDVASGHILAAEHDCQGRFILVAEPSTSFMEIARTMHRIDPKIPKPMMLMPNAMSGMMSFFDWMNNKLLRTPRLVTPELTELFKGKTMNTSNGRAKAVLGWTPEVSILDSLRATIERLREIHKAEGK